MKASAELYSFLVALEENLCPSLPFPISRGYKTCPFLNPLQFSSVHFSSVSQSCLTLCDPMNSSKPGLPVHQQPPESTRTHVHRISNAISSSVIPFSSCPQFLPASESFPISQLFARGGQSTGLTALASVLPKNTQD